MALGMTLRVPISDATPDLTQKIKVPFFSKVAKITNHVGNRMFVKGPASVLENR